MEDLCKKKAMVALQGVIMRGKEIMESLPSNPDQISLVPSFCRSIETFCANDYYSDLDKKRLMEIKAQLTNYLEER